MEGYEKLKKEVLEEHANGDLEVPDVMKNYIAGQEYFKDPTDERTGEMIYALGNLKATMNLVTEVWDEAYEEHPDLFTNSGIAMVNMLLKTEKDFRIFHDHPVGKAIAALIDENGEDTLDENAVLLLNYAVRRLVYMEATREEPEEEPEEESEEGPEEVDDSKLN